MAKPISYRDLIVGLRELGLDSNSIVLAHIELGAFGELRGGTETLIGALVASCGTVVMPAFTYQTMIVPPEGPPNNGMDYFDRDGQNARAEMFHADLPVHSDLGAAPEAFRRLPQARRSAHPVLSFAAAGQHAAEIVAAQSLADAWGPLNWLHDHHGDVLLLGADHTANMAIHLAEKMAGRKQFVRWTVDGERAYRFQDYPGCRRGFNAIAPRLAWMSQQVTLGLAMVQRIPLRSLVETAVQLIQADPAALLCDDATCALCNAVRAGL